MQSLQCLCSARPAFRLYRNAQAGRHTVAAAAAPCATAAHTVPAARNCSRTLVSSAQHSDPLCLLEQQQMLRQPHPQSAAAPGQHAPRLARASSAPYVLSPDAARDGVSSAKWNEVLRQAQPHEPQPAPAGRAASEVAADADEMERQWRLPPHEWRPHPTLLSGRVSKAAQNEGSINE